MLIQGECFIASYPLGRKIIDAVGLFPHRLAPEQQSQHFVRQIIKILKEFKLTLVVTFIVWILLLIDYSVL